jgi:hypothetical protein
VASCKAHCANLETLASQIAVVANLWTTGAEGLGSSQSRRITKPRRDPNNHGWTCGAKPAPCASVATH